MEGGAPARQGWQRSKGKPCPSPPVPPRPRPPGLFKSSARGRTEKASIPSRPWLVSCCTCVPALSPSPCSPARSLPRPAPAAMESWSWLLGGAYARGGPCAAAAAARRPASGPPAAGCAGAAGCADWLRQRLLPRWPHLPCWPPPAGSCCPAWRARSACPWRLARCSSPVSARARSAALPVRGADLDTGEGPCGRRWAMDPQLRSGKPSPLGLWEPAARKRRQPPCPGLTTHASFGEC